MPRVDGKAPHELLPGEYGKWDADSVWYAIPPRTDLCANLGAHKVEEHADRTITVTPSILVQDSEARWHGFLTRGEWSLAK